MSLSLHHKITLQLHHSIRESSKLGTKIDGERYRTMFYEATVGEAAPVGETVAPASEVGADQEKLDELRSLIQGHRAI